MFSPQARSVLSGSLVLCVLGGFSLALDVPVSLLGLMTHWLSLVYFGLKLKPVQRPGLWPGTEAGCSNLVEPMDDDSEWIYNLGFLTGIIA